MFSERGYDGATFQEIAVRADLTRPAINHYFSSKKLLYCDVVDQTNELVVANGIQNAKRALRLMDRLSEFIAVVMRASSEDPSVSPFLVTAVLESQRHPELSRNENDAVAISRVFLNWAVNDAIERGELKADTDVPSLAETLLIVLVGVGFYAGYLGNYQEMRAVIETLRRLLEGAFWERGA
ncbi:hypothetical protein MCNS_56730 [Mycobacterium conspicuum]|uniref:Uncharacterized protein n=1 Tax=Mycobacterium conspicuum TaxID=44010 RepID=A0A1X1TIF4_9MYCO|nr:TetR family transcriptional regulator [Mycobacterium conspicuum]BBZ42610.1 hypothetical protein MCNS_56730 [Mycobacterium conspicuum]